jgi:thioredoxin reductase
MSEDYHVVVVGGSWAGLAAAMQLGRARRRVLVVDAGRPRNRFAHAGHGFLGQDGRSPTAIRQTFSEQVLAYPTVRIEEGEAVDAYRSGDGVFRVELASGEVVGGRRVVLATGIVDELPSTPGLRERWGATVLHCPYCHGYEVADARLGVLATGEMAAHQALLLPDWSAQVTLFTNDAFEPTAEQSAALAERGVRVETRSVVSLVGPLPALTGVRLGDGAVVEVDAIFTASRTHMASSLAERLGCAFDEGPFGPIVRTDARKETTVPGVYCAGDAARAPHNATWAAADGVTAGISAHQSLISGLPRPAAAGYPSSPGVAAPPPNAAPAAGR